MLCAVNRKIITYLNKLSKNKVLLYCLASILLHSAGLLLLSFLKNQGPLFSSPQDIVSVDIMEEPLDKHAKNKSAPELKAHSQAKQEHIYVNKNIVLSQKPKINFTGITSAEIFEQKIISKNVNSEEKGSYFEDNEFRPTKGNYDSYETTGAYGYLEAGGIKKIFEQNKFYSEIWKKVRHLAGFPKDFLNFRLKGNVRIHVLLNEKGQILGDFLKVSSETSPLLELYSLAVLTLALEKPLPQTFWASNQQIPMVFEFNYRHVQSEMDEYLTKEEMHPKPEYIQGNILKFVSTRYIDPKLIQKIQELYEDYFPPVIVLPGGFIVDVVHLYKKYNHWKKHGFKSSATVREEEQNTMKAQLLLALQKPNKDLLNRLSNGHLDLEKYNEHGEKSGFQLPRTWIHQRGSSFDERGFVK